MLGFVLLSSVLFLYCVQCYLRGRRIVASANNVTNVKMYPGGNSFYGNALQFKGGRVRALEMFKSMSEFANKNNGICLYWMPYKAHYVITNPADAAIALNKCLDKTYFYDFFKPWLGDGLFTSGQKIWQPRRRALNAAFHTLLVGSFQCVFNKHVRSFADDLAKKVGQGPFSIRAYLCQSALDALCESSFGIPVHGKDNIFNKEYASVVDKIQPLIMKRMLRKALHFDFIFRFTEMKRTQDGLIEKLHRCSMRTIEKRREELNNSGMNTDFSSTGSKFKPFLELLLELSASKGILNDTAIREELDTIAAAGHETMVSTLSFALIVLGTYQNIQDKVFAELTEIFGDSDRDADKHDLARMVYMEAVINETLRLFPVGFLVGREAHNDLKLTNHTIPAGSTVLISYWGLHHNALWGPDVEKFNPERWFDPATLNARLKCFGGYSMGMRRCIGKNYANIFMKTLLAHTLRRYRVIGDVTKLKLKLDVLLRPGEGSEITLELRRKQE